MHDDKKMDADDHDNGDIGDNDDNGDNGDDNDISEEGECVNWWWGSEYAYSDESDEDVDDELVANNDKNTYS